MTCYWTAIVLLAIVGLPCAVMGCAAPVLRPPRGPGRMHCEGHRRHRGARAARRGALGARTVRATAAAAAVGPGGGGPGGGGGGEIGKGTQILDKAPRLYKKPIDYTKTNMFNNAPSKYTQAHNIKHESQHILIQ